MKQDGFALITGASRGLGMAFARALAERHCNLVLVARSPEPLHAFAHELRRSNPVSVLTLPAPPRPPFSPFTSISHRREPAKSWRNNSQAATPRSTCSSTTPALVSAENS